MFAHVQDGQIISISHHPDVEWDGERWWDLRDPTIRAERGWLEIAEVERPADTNTTTHELSYEVVDGQPTETWTAREWTPEELTARTQAANDQALRDGLQAAIDAALARQAVYQTVIDTPNSTIKSNPAPYIVDLARQGKRSERALIRLARLVGGLTGTADTGTD